MALEVTVSPSVTQCHLVSPSVTPWRSPRTHIVTEVTVSPNVTRCHPMVLPKDPRGVRGHGVTHCHPMSPGVSPWRSPGTRMALEVTVSPNVTQCHPPMALPEDPHSD